MTRIDIGEAKAQLSKYMDRVAKGETIILCRRNVPIAEIVPFESPAKQRSTRVGKGRKSK